VDARRLAAALWIVRSRRNNCWPARRARASRRSAADWSSCTARWSRD